MDDFRLKSLSAQAVQYLCEISTERYKRKSIITSYYALDEWVEVFNNDLLASAAIECLTYHVHVLILRGDGYRQLSCRKEVG
ncbi:MAG: ATP-binding protein [Anaerolineales bacterium]